MHFSQLSNKKVLITGVNGFVGSSLAKGFLAQGSSVHGTLRKTSNTEKFEKFQSRVNFHVLDLESKDETQDLFKIVRPDFVVHTAQPIAYELNSPDAVQTHIVRTGRMATNILESALVVSPLKIVHCCSSSLYGARNHSPFSEDQELLPDSALGAVKLNQRNIFKSYADQHGLPIVLARIFRVYGPHDSDRKLILKALHARQHDVPLSLSEGPFKRDFIYIDDLVEAIFLMCITPTDPGLELNLGSGTQHSAAEIIELMNEILGSEIPVSATSYYVNALDKLSYQADMSRTKKILGWQPRTSIREGLRRTIEWAQQNVEAR
jgi:nucleoside-diphosphate-sugar epimerase